MVSSLGEPWDVRAAIMPWWPEQWRMSVTTSVISVCWSVGRCLFTQSEGSQLTVFLAGLESGQFSVLTKH